MTPITQTIIGEIALVSIFVLSLWGIYSPRVDDGVFGRLLYMVKALVCLAGIIHMVEDTLPKNLVVSLLTCVTLHMFRDIIVAQYGTATRRWWDAQVRQARAALNDRR